jgi:hypothetical protein
MSYKNPLLDKEASDQYAFMVLKVMLEMFPDCDCKIEWRRHSVGRYWLVILTADCGVPDISSVTFGIPDRVRLSFQQEVEFREWFMGQTAHALQQLKTAMGRK